MSNIIERQNENALLTVIAQAAKNPEVDIDKMEALLAMHERIQKANAEKLYFSALAMMQGDLPIITKDGAVKDKFGNIQSRYATWESIAEAIKPDLMKHGFSLSFTTFQKDGMMMIRGVLSHRDGHKETSEAPLPADKTGNKNDVQAIGSTISYGKRYMACALLNIVAQGEDDDGNATLPQEEPPHIQSLRDAAQQGSKALIARWGALTGEQRALAQGWFGGLKKDAEAIDKAKQ